MPIGIVPPVEHDSLRAYNTVIRPRGANDAPREPSAEEAAQITAIVDSMRKIRPAAAGLHRERRRRRRFRVHGAARDRRSRWRGASAAEALPALRVAYRRGVGAAGQPLVYRPPTVPRDSIVAQINIDMIARGGPDDEAGRPGIPAGHRLPAALHRARRPGGAGEPGREVQPQFDYTYDADGHPDHFYCRSDHYMYARYGIPIAFFSTGGHRDYHQVTDEVQYLDFDQVHPVTRFVADLAGQLADWTTGRWWTSRSRIRSARASSEAEAGACSPKRLPEKHLRCPSAVAPLGGFGLYLSGSATADSFLFLWQRHDRTQLARADPPPAHRRRDAAVVHQLLDERHRVARPA